MRRHNQWRWRLARLFAPVPIIASPGEDNGVWIMTRTGDDAYSMVVWVRAETFDLRMDSNFGPLRFDPEWVGGYQPTVPTGSFSGTLGRVH